MASYKETYTFEQRVKESRRALDMGKIPIICERRDGSSQPELSTKKFVVAPTMTADVFIKALSDRVSMEIVQKIFLYLGDDVLRAQRIKMSDLYRAHREGDGFIYVTYSSDKGDATRQLGTYHSMHPEQERRQEALKILEAGKLPIIVEKEEDSTLRDLKDDKFQVDPAMSISEFTQLVNTCVALEAGRRVHLYMSGHALNPCGVPMSDVYQKFKGLDSFLFITYSGNAPTDETPLFPPPLPEPVTNTPDVVEVPEPTPVKSRAAPPPTGPYQETHTEQERRAIAHDALTRGKVPIICERRPGSVLPDLRKKKFIVAPTMRLNNLITLLSKEVESEVSDEIFLFIGDNVLTARDITTQELYTNNRGTDGLLCITYDTSDNGAGHMGVCKSTHTYAYRLSEAERAIALGKTPIIVDKVDGARVKEIEQKKFWVPFEMPVDDFVELLRTRIADETNGKVYLFVDARPVNPACYTTMSRFYSANVDDDKFLYITFSDCPSGR